MAPKRALRLMKFPIALTLRHRGGAFAAANAAAAARSAASRTRADSAAARFFFSALTRLRSARLLARALSASRDAFASRTALLRSCVRLSALATTRAGSSPRESCRARRYEGDVASDSKPKSRNRTGLSGCRVACSPRKSTPSPVSATSNPRPSPHVFSAASARAMRRSTTRCLSSVLARHDTVSERVRSSIPRTPTRFFLLRRETRRDSESSEAFFSSFPFSEPSLSESSLESSRACFALRQGACLLTASKSSLCTSLSHRGRGGGSYRSSNPGPSVDA
mmetsp:Transcript_8375/g.34989  ORF Transcript_8375/g.34989 Transcript_8375/m.34989 type:complete len:280 (-) Transcript_8375:558-1397(-)